MTHLINSAGTLAYEYGYDAWGRLRNPANHAVYAPESEPTLFLNRGYTGHEHLPLFGVINMNARLYDPVIGRFLSPAPFIQSSDFTQNYNRYSYAYNNPLIYTDPDGEWIHTVIGALVGGIANLAMNWKNIDGFWQGVAAFGVGAGAGAATASSFGASSGVWVGLAASAAGGAVVSGTNSVIEQTGNNFSGMNNVNWGQVGVSSTIGGVAGLAGGAAGYGASNMSFLVNGVSSPVLRSAVVSPLAAGAGHVAGSTTANLFMGQNFGDAFSNSFQGIGKSMVIGGATGVSATIGVSYANGINPISGKMMWPKNDGFQNNPEYTILKKGTMLDRYGDDAGQFVAPQGTSFDQRALPPNYINKSLSTYKVTQPLPVLQGTTAPSFWFNSGGGGTQYMLPIQYYLNKGYLIRVR
jgi:RHS repeat-associated protein